MYLLDTNHCSRFINGEAILQQKISELEPEQIQTCAIVRGELIFMAEFSEHREENLPVFQEFLSNILTHPVDENCADIYGRLKSDLRQHFGPKEKRKKFNLETNIGVSDNDLWIASVALRHDLVLITHDGDFDRIREVATQLKVESWLMQ